MLISFSIATLWFIRGIRPTLFWIYLWQLKEYHIGRFVDHFRTAKGKQIFFNPLFGAKIVLLALSFVWFQGAFIGLFIVYVAEVAQAMRQGAQGKILTPVGTAKTAFLILVCFLGEGIFLAIAYIAFQKILLQLLLIFDILLPVFVSFAVLLFQPLALIARNRIIAKARAKRAQMKNLIVVGITGSYGKTSTKEFLARILSKKFNVLKTKEHQNSEVGIANCIAQELKPEHRVFVCEMGAYGKGGVKLLAGIAKPSIGVLTGINEQHMATFGSQENIIKTKYELIESLPANGVAFFNAKNKYCVELYNKTAIKKILYGQQARFAGEENILGAMAVAKELGMSQEEISGAVEEIGNVFPGVKVKKGSNGITILDATYSANPDGAIANLEYLQTFPSKKIIVMPCLVELGSASKEVHKRIAQKIAQVCDLAIITTKDRFQDIKEGAQGSEKIIFLENPTEIVNKIKSTTQPGDVVLLEGRVPLVLLSSNGLSANDG